MSTANLKATVDNTDSDVASGMNWYEELFFYARCFAHTSRCVAEASPMHQVLGSSDLLPVIFRLASETSPGRDLYLALSAVCKTCRRWRLVAGETHTLWNRARLTGTNITAAHIAWLFERIEDVPAEIPVDILLAFEESPVTVKPLKKLFETCIGASLICKSRTSYLGRVLVVGALGLPTGLRLFKLTLESNCYQTSLFLEDLTALSKLYSTIGLEGDGLPQCTTLVLHDIANMSATSLDTLLETSSPVLERLSLKRLDCKGLPTKVDIVRLPRLAELEICYGSQGMISVIRRYRTPRLKKLILPDVDNDFHLEIHHDLLTTVEELCLRRCRWITELGLKLCSEASRALTILDVSQVENPEAFFDLISSERILQMNLFPKVTKLVVTKGDSNAKANYLALRKARGLADIVCDNVGDTEEEGWAGDSEERSHQWPAPLLPNDDSRDSSPTPSSSPPAPLASPLRWTFGRQPPALEDDAEHESGEWPACHAFACAAQAAERRGCCRMGEAKLAAEAAQESSKSARRRRTNVDVQEMLANFIASAAELDHNNADSTRHENFEPAHLRAHAEIVVADIDILAAPAPSRLASIPARVLSAGELQSAVLRRGQAKLARALGACFTYADDTQ
ncbi:hypothetical protein GGX14DRAFT_557405 [Mycena pura]|uniref:Uncharacterized protein n=1 Tax=Mycena pura TaxID=153505 RepID=A0AAD7E2B2_9AGAR|nr:hypothetical protein GGX14DRAFT_557405 [Mycena pura]